MEYDEFIRNKSQWGLGDGFDPGELPGFLFDFQEYLVRWALQTGRSLIAADCGLGKSPCALAWSQKVIEHTNKPVLLVTPLAVGAQFMDEAVKFGIEASRSRDGVITPDKRIFITNYQQLHKFDPSQFAGVVCDESSCIKDFKSQTKGVVVEFMRTIPYRLLCTATAAPNDYWELGTSSEALGYLGFRDMITTFFKQETSSDIHGWGRVKYRFRGHAQEPFWSWVCSWARALQKPSDMGFDDSRFILPPLIEKSHVIECSKARPGELFPMPAKDLSEERQERRDTIKERCEAAAGIAEDHDGITALWGELNDECDLMEKLLPDSVQVKGAMSDEQKEEYLLAFAAGEVKQLICKPKIGAWGLNFQRCHNIVELPSHSFERHYQVVRRCYRFGQTNPVTSHMVVSEGERKIVDNLQRKKEQVELMFRSLVHHMNDSMHIVSTDNFPEREALPSWL
jgi:hypothetical protein